MPVFDLFSKRQRRLRGEVPEVFQYEDLPQPFRVQVVHILRDALGNITEYGSDLPAEVYKFIHDTLAREYGVFGLNPQANNQQQGVFNFLLQTQQTEKALYVIDV